jgi:hypothetical protein
MDDHPETPERSADVPEFKRVDVDRAAFEQMFRHPLVGGTCDGSVFESAWQSVSIDNDSGRMVGHGDLTCGRGHDAHDVLDLCRSRQHRCKPEADSGGESQARCSGTFESRVMKHRGSHAGKRATTSGRSAGMPWQPPQRMFAAVITLSIVICHSQMILLPMIDTVGPGIAPIVSARAQE